MRPGHVEEWLADDPDPKTRAELVALIEAADSGDVVAQAEIDDAFRGPLTFGTAGLRGRMGPGPNRMNRATVARAAAGIAAYLLERHEHPAVVIGFDARHRSADFARDCAEILAGAGVSPLVLPRPLPTPVLAYAVRALGVAAGLMVTASHNPAHDNGLKVYLGDGRQIVPPADEEIAACIAAAGPVRDLPRSDGHATLGDDLVDQYVDQAARVPQRDTPRDVVSLHTAMHGVGTAVLQDAAVRAGFRAPFTVVAQERPDPDFPTVAFPNPEEPGALDLAIAEGRRLNVDVIIATDPDADRCALVVGVPHGRPSHADSRTPGEWVMLSGDEVGSLLAWWLLRRGGFEGTMANSLVSSTMLEAIAREAGIPCTSTLTGFKWISRVPDLGYGYEEALGYCVDPRHVADKDGITAALLALELIAALNAEGRTVFDVLDELALRHGVHATRQMSIRLPTVEAITHAVAALRSDPPERLGDLPVEEVVDLAIGFEDLPPTDGILLRLPGARVIVRPSGTEPKVKCYLQVIRAVDGAGLAIARELAEATLDRLQSSVSGHLGLA
jgi:phosphomannomutase